MNILELRAFLRALTVPPEGMEDVASTAPPRVLFVWPEVVTVECVVASVEVTYKQLALDGTCSSTPPTSPSRRSSTLG